MEIVGHEEIALSGAVTLETVLNRLPQVVPSYSSAANNPSHNGVALVDLRGLGPSRNLVLLDGRRVIGADATNAVDLNTIPPSLIDHVEVVTGGASAVYGADAVSGVVNVILKHRFDGLVAETRSAVSQRGDAEEYEARFTGGHSGVFGAVMASFSWTERDPLGKGARGFSDQGDTPSSAVPAGDYLPGPNRPSQAAVDQVFKQYGVAPGLVSPRGGVGGFSFNTDGTLFSTGFANNPALTVQNYRGGHNDIIESLYPGVYGYNYQPFNKLILPLRRWSGALFAESPRQHGLRFWSRALITRYSSATSLAPTPALFDPNPLYPGQNVTAFTAPVTNPYIPKDLALLLASRTGDVPALAGAGGAEDFLYRFRPTSLGPRESTDRSTVLNVMNGLEAELPFGWRAEASVDYGRYDRDEIQDGLVSVRRVEQLLYSPSGGEDYCAGGFDPFGGVLSPACRNYVRVRASYATRIEQSDAVGSVFGPLVKLPAGPVRGVAGVEYRLQRYAFRPPDGVSPGEVAGITPFNPLAGSVRHIDVFAEASVPLLRDARFAKSLEATVGYRRSSERMTGVADSLKAEIIYAPTASLRFRASAQRAQRAPDILERYEPARADSASGVDPCNAGPSRTPQILALCERQAAAAGFAPGFVSDFSQPDQYVPVTDHGDAAVKPERATTLTMGAAMVAPTDTPLLSRLTTSVDAYAIRIKGAIGYRDPQLILNACYNLNGATNPTYDPSAPACRALSRSAVDFSLFNVDSPESNQALLSTGGVDVSLGFRTDLARAVGWRGLGVLDTRILASWLAYFRTQASSAEPRYDLAGTIAYGTGYQSLPRWKLLGETTWSSGPVAVSLASRYIDAMRHSDRIVDPASTATGPGASWYFDLSARWSVSRRVELRAGILNLFDRGPELFSPAVDAGTEPSTYDVVGRRFWVDLALKV